MTVPRSFIKWEKAKEPADVEFRDNNEDAAVFVYNSPLQMTATKFHGNNCTDRLSGRAPKLGGCIKVGAVTSVRYGESAAVTDTIGYDFLLEELNSTLYTDLQILGPPLRPNPKSRGRLFNLTSVPSPASPHEAFLTLNDADYQRIVRVCRTIICAPVSA
jgi:hypothetical protein